LAIDAHGFALLSKELLMNRSSFTRLATGALALFLCVALLAVDSRGGDKGKGKGDPKKTGQEEIVHGCISKVTLASGTTLGTVTFEHPKFGGTVKVVETGTTKTDIEVCGESKTLAQLKTLVEAVKPGEARYCGIARIDDRMSLKALKIIVCNDAADKD
jgi:hypothetical protein